MSILSLSLHPMMAKRKREPFNDKRWLFEFKWDGIRAFIYKEDDKIKIETRRGLNVTKQFPELDIRTHEDVIIDGELVVVREGKPSFQDVLTRVQAGDPLRIKVLSEKMPALFVAFDIVYAGKWINGLPLMKRKEILRECVEETDTLIITPFVREEGVALYKKARSMGFEGIMAKEIQSPYIFGKRVEFWLKIKETKTIDAIICGITLGEGKRAPYFGSLVLGLYKNGDIVHIGNVGTGFSEEELRHLLDILLPLQTDKPTCKGVEVKDRKIVWVKPNYVAEVEYQELTRGCKLRMPRYVRLRPDKHPGECTWNQLEC